MYSHSFAELVGSRPTTTAPIDITAQSSRIHSSRVRERTATRSPWRTPRASRPCASAETRSAASSRATGRQSSAVSSRYAGPAGASRTASRQSSGTVRLSICGIVCREGDEKRELGQSLTKLGSLMRTIWNGSISFGLVNIPVGLALATQRQDVSFRTLHRECGTPIKQKRWCPVHERDVEPDELVKGWEFSKGQYVLVEESDLEAVALQRSQSIEILRFVRLEDVDPVYFDRTYYLAPDRPYYPAPAGADAQRRPYVLLLRAMEESGMAAVGKFVLWGKENLCLIRSRAGVLLLEPLFFAEDGHAKTEIEEAVTETDVQKAELQLAEQVISSLSGEWTPEDFENDYRKDLAQMLEAKLAGQEIVAPEPAAEAPVIDLMEALRQSVADAQSRRSAEGSRDGKAASKGGSRSRKATAKKSA